MAAISSDSSESITIRTIPVQSNRERYAYMFMRLSGVGLLILAVGHMVIQHLLNSSANLTIQFVAVQWSSWGWKAYDIMLLWLAIPHGFNGLRNVLDDYVHNPGLNRAISILIGVAVVATLAYATLGMVLFDSAAFQ